MQSPKEQHNLKLQFREQVSCALEKRWKRDGRYSAKEILDDIRSNEDVWKAMAEQFAEKAAMDAIGRQIATRDPGIDAAQESFPFTKELPVPSITYKGSVVSTLRSKAEEYIWFSNWYERRHTGTVRRSKLEKKKLAKIKYLARIVEKYPGDDSGVTVQAILKAREQRLEALRKQSKNRSAR